MEASLQIAKTGLEAQQKQLSVISNNLANVNTTGFKRGRAQFEDLMYQTVVQPGAQVTEENKAPTGLMYGTGTKIASTEKIFTQGSQTQTDNPLDVAINGRGFIRIQRPGGGDIAYTRDGKLQVNDQGQVVTADGYLVDPALTIPQGATQVSISSDGTVTAITTSATQPQTIGQIQLADFINPAGLQAIGENLYKETTASGAPQQGNPGENGLGTLSQGALESSNVNIVEELINMIESQRAFEVNSKAISTVDQMLQFLNQHT